MVHPVSAHPVAAGAMVHLVLAHPAAAGATDPAAGEAGDPADPGADLLTALATDALSNRRLRSRLPIRSPKSSVLADGVMVLPVVDGDTVPAEAAGDPTEDLPADLGVVTAVATDALLLMTLIRSPTSRDGVAGVAVLPTLAGAVTTTVTTAGEVTTATTTDGATTLATAAGIKSLH